MRRITSLFGLAAILLLLPAMVFAALPVTDATGYLYNAETGKFLSHGVTSVSNSGAKVDDYGVPVVVKNEGSASEFSGYTHLRFQMSDYFGRYLRIVAGGLDCAGSSYHKWAAIEKDGGILLRCIYTDSQVGYAKQGWFLAIDDDGTLVLADGEENAAVWQWKSAGEQIAIVDEAENARIAAIGAKGGLTVASAAELKAALASMSSADKTSSIVNPTMFANTDGWTVNNIQGTAISNGDYRIQNAAGTQATVSQKVTGLTPGFYKVDVQAFYRASVLARCVTYGNNGFRFSNAYVQANDNKVLIRDWYAISTDGHSKPTSRSNIKDEFDEGEKYTHTLYTWVGADGVLDLSIAVPSYSAGDYPNWICFNNVRLTYYFSSEDLGPYKTQLENAVSTANALTSSLPAAQKVILGAVVEAYDKEWTTAADYEVAIAAVVGATEAAQPFAALYADYKALRTYIAERLLAQTESYDDEVGATATYGDEASALDGQLELAETLLEMEDTEASLWRAALKWLKNVTIKGYGIDLTWMIANSDFSDTNYKDAWTEELTSSTTAGVTSGLMRYYNCNFKLYQRLSLLLPAGAYRFTMDGFERTNDPMNTAYSDYAAGTSKVTGTMFMNDNEKTVTNLFDVQSVTDNSLGGSQPEGAAFYVPNGSGAARKYIDAGLYPNMLNAVLLEDAVVELGYRCANTKAWTCFDNFRLYYTGKVQETQFIIEATEGLTPLCLPFDLEAGADYLTSLYAVGGVEDGKALLYPVDRVAAGTPCVALFNTKEVSAIAQPVGNSEYVLPWEGGSLLTDIDNFTWNFKNVKDETSPATELVFTPLDAMNMQFSVNAENLAVRRYLASTVYTSVSESVVANYNVTPPARRDVPNRVMIPMPQKGLSDIVLTYKEEGSEAEPVETAVPDAHETAYIDNLLPQKSYEYSITAGGVKVGSGKFRVTGNLRMIYAPSANNIRDLGGWQTYDGERLAYGHLYRGSTLNGWVTATAEDLQRLRDLGVGAEIDLRWKESYDKDMGCGVSAFGFTEGDDYYFAAANDYLASDLMNEATQKRLREEFEFIVKHFRLGSAVYFHCAWGADRTGMLAFLLETLLGVSADGFYKDYELTSFSPAGNRLKSALKERFDVIQGMPGNTIKERAEYYFINHLGVSQMDVDYFRSVMLPGEDPTAIDALTAEQPQGETVRDGKYFRDGHIVIVRNGVEYSVSGQMK
jgi:protein-tyrosine phosphatase